MPPGIVFAIVWPILYFLMGTAAYIISETLSDGKSRALRFYFAQLAVNIIWPFLFFRLEYRLLAFIVLVILFILVIITTYNFFKINKWAGILMLPYVLWLIFAGVLNFSIYMLNK